MKTFTLWLTTKCNLSCKYCYENDKDANISISMRLINKAIEFMQSTVKEGEPISIRFHGGEPMLEFEKMKYCISTMDKWASENKHTIMYSMTTNATLFTKDNLDFVIKHINDLSISIDGTPENHDRNRIHKSGNSTSEPVMKAISEIKKVRTDIRLRMTVVPDQVANLYNNLTYLIGMGVRFVSPALDACSNEWNEELLERVERTLVEVEQYALQKEILGDVKIGMIYDSGTIVKRLSKCNGGLDKFVIYSDGKIYPCTILTPSSVFEIGDLDNGLNYKTIEELTEIYIKENEICSGCNFYDFCNCTRCKLINKTKTGDYFTPSAIDCGIQRIAYKMMRRSM